MRAEDLAWSSWSLPSSIYLELVHHATKANAGLTPVPRRRKTRDTRSGEERLRARQPRRSSGSGGRSTRRQLGCAEDGRGPKLSTRVAHRTGPGAAAGPTLVPLNVAATDACVSSEIPVVRILTRDAGVPPATARSRLRPPAGSLPASRGRNRYWAKRSRSGSAPRR